VSDDIIAQANTQPAQAQEETLDEVVVTGSRIVRRDFEANSPILTVEEELFDNTMSIGIETVLNQLPQFVPAVTQFVTNDVQPSATNTPGASTLSLRALGANRNLVLIDGRRGMPINASGAISTDTIPSAAIARVETITGGASSVYGADAMAGVVNFILKKNFEGTNFEVRYGQTAEGDGQELRATGMLGANFADDEGNVMMGFEYSTRGEVAQADREYYRNWLAEPTADGTAMFWTDSGFVTGSLPGQPRRPARRPRRGLTIRRPPR
jgi:outer membrane receptor protein involved in Fe transport